MSIKNWNAGIIRPVPVAPTGPYQNSSAPGVWTLDQQAYWDKQNLWPTAGSVNPDAFIENLFSTYLYTGNSSTQTITNGIDLSGKGGLVWIKSRGSAYSNGLFDTARGANKYLISNIDANQNTFGVYTDLVTGFNSNGFSLGSDQNLGYVNFTGNYASWTFREQAKFFDIVTYTGNGTNRTIAHNLGSVPGCIIIKRTDLAAGWQVYHRSLANTEYLVLNNTAAKATGATRWNSTTPTSTEFSLGTDSTVNANSGTYVAYLFAHDAGGFGLTGTDNVISCGSFTTDGSGNATVNLGYEPQFVMFKSSSNTGSWAMVDTMRGMSVNPSETNKEFLYANLSNAASVGSGIGVTSTGFNMAWFANQTFIYIAIRRGPMKTPTSGTSVFSPVTYTGNNSTTRQITSGFTPDAVFREFRNDAQVRGVFDRLRGASSTSAARLDTTATSAEVTGNAQCDMSSVMDGILSGTAILYNSSPDTYVNYFFQRAPGFFDVVCYTGTGSATTQTHNLGVAPELLIVKSRDTAVNWVVWASAPTPQQNQYALNLNTAGAWGSSGDKNWGATLTGAPNMTSTTFSLGDYVGVNGSAKTYVAYLFASCPGVSKVGSYTGTGALQTINCGFAAGARFVLIKRTDSTGDWWVYDSARGITSGNDPYLFLNSTAAEVTNTNYVDTASTGFQVTAAAPAGLNANGGTYLFLAIA